MSAICVADIHLTDRPADDYRWGLFDWVLKHSADADEFIILGDLCDAKDRHGARLVNRLYREMVKLEQRFRTIIVKGNHDYLDPNHPFFEFLGDASDTVFVKQPVELKLSVGRVLMVPAGVRWDFKIPQVDYVMTHATFNGAKAETGYALTGVDPGVLDGFKGKVLSGDIHVPQRLRGGSIEYVGAPYHVRFGDSFTPRLVWLGSDGQMKDLHFPAPKKHRFYVTMPEDLLEEKAASGDHVKVRCLLRRAEYVKWRDYREEIKRICSDRGWLLFGAEPVPVGEDSKLAASTADGISADPAAVMVDYASRKKAGSRLLEMGAALLKSVKLES